MDSSYYDIAMKPPEELALMMRSRHSLITIETHEEARAIELVKAAAQIAERSSFAWSLIQGLIVLHQRGRTRIDEKIETGSPLGAMGALATVEGPWVAALMDVQRHFDDDHVVRALRETAARGHHHEGCLVLIGPVIELPVELERLSLSMPLPLPGAEAITDIVKREFTLLRSKAPAAFEAKLSQSQLRLLTEALIGLTGAEVRRLVHQVTLRDGKLDVHDLREVRDAKRRAMAHRGKLEFVPVSASLASLGGLANLKLWLQRRRLAFSAKAREFGLTPPRGVLLLGVPGCGKSLCARLIAGEWQRPLLRLDTGALYNKFIGASESNLRESLRQAEASAPCVLWIDEIEKAFASGGGLEHDGGVSHRLFATMLNWMNDRTSDVFIVATANDVTQLPPELLRKGRFDEIFFVDLPREAARWEIFEIHLRHRGRDPGEFDLQLLVERTNGYSGTEIEQVVVGGLFRAFEQSRNLATEDLVAAIQTTRPMAVTVAERISHLRAWARDRCVMAND